MPVTHSAARASAASQTVPLPATARMPRWKAGAAAICALLLSACAGMPAPVPAATDASEEAVSRMAPPVQGNGKSLHMRPMSAHDIFLEWGGLDSKPHKKAGVSALARAPASAWLPDYSASIQQMMANAACRACEQMPYHQLILQASDLHGVPSGLIHAVIRKESSYNPGARSKQNARGLMQLTPDTARFVGVANSDRLYDPQTNIYAGTAYLKYLMRTHSTFNQVLAAYNSGPGNVRKYKGVPPFVETMRYVKDVKKYFAATSGDLR